MLPEINALTNSITNFILELDRWKAVNRTTYVNGGEKCENSAEHSWHLAIVGVNGKLNELLPGWLSSQDHLLIPTRSDARFCDWAIHQSIWVWMCAITSTDLEPYRLLRGCLFPVQQLCLLGIHIEKDGGVFAFHPHDG